MPFIDSTYFDEPIPLAGLNTAPIRDAVRAAIAEYEPEFLRMLMGPSLYAAFIAGTRSGFSSGFSSGFGGTVADRWTWVLDGNSYTCADGTVHVWPGIRKPIAHYVYFNYRRDNLSQPTSLGEAVANAENATIITPYRKLAKAWDRMVDWNRILERMLLTLLTNGLPTYPEFNHRETARDVYHHIPAI